MKKNINQNLALNDNYKQTQTNEKKKITHAPHSLKHT